MGRPITYFNTGSSGQEIKDWYFTGSDGIKTSLIRALMDGVVIFEKELTLVLPCNPADSTIVLEDFIRAADPIGDYRIINIILNPSGSNPGACHHPTIRTGNLNGLEVTFTNNGSIEQRCNTDYAFQVNSSIKFINNGYLRGKGGDGGKGGTGHVGKSSSGSTTKWEGPFYNGSYYWQHSCWPHPGSRNVTTTYVWNGSSGTAGTDEPCGSWSTSKSSGSSTYYRDARKSGDGACDGDTKDQYAIKRKTTSSYSMAGGAGGVGGIGGIGVCYKRAATSGTNGSTGEPGSDPETTRGYTGGRGGSGGSWGQSGATGARGGGSGSYGTAGTAGDGVAIRGSAILASGSQLNNGTWHVVGTVQS